MGDHGLARALGQRHLAAARELMGGIDQHDEIVVPQHDGRQPGLGRLKGEHAEVEAAVCHFGADLPRRHPPYVHVYQRVGLAEPVDERQHHVHRGLVGPEQHAAAPQVAQVTHRRFGFFRQPQQPLGVVAEQPARLGERRILGGAVEQTLADALFEPFHRLAHGRLGTVELSGRAREAPLGGYS